MALLFVFIVLILLPFSAPHPQCLDFQPPFENDRITYCQEYRDFGCCTRELDRRAQSRINNITQLPLDRPDEQCEPYLRNVSCLKCSPYAAHIFDTESGGIERRFPTLCRSYCEEAFQKCHPALMRMFSLRAQDFGFVEDPTPELLLNYSKSFCAEQIPEESPYCYPRVLDGPQLPGFDTESEGDLGCVCALPVATGLRNPLAAVHGGDGSGRLYIVEQIGQIRVLLANNTLLSEPFLDITGRVLTSTRRGDERGLLGLTFHPEFEDNGRFFVYYSASVRNNHESRISEFHLQDLNPYKANASSERIILTVSQPRSNHNGGQLLFKDGYLLVFLGDGGGAGDRFGSIGNGQDRSTLLGSVLRIDVDKKDPGKEYAVPPTNPFVGYSNVRPEIWAYGLRNPWRCSVDRGDRQTGEGAGRVFCGDVGQSRYEEIDIIEGGRNYGWRAFEGDSCFDGNQCSGQTIRNASIPISIYGRDEGVSVTGGYVYRGCHFPNLRGLYIFGDYGSGKLFALRENKTSGEWQQQELCMGDDSVCTGELVGTRRVNNILSFGEDENGELYILATAFASPTSPQGVVYQIIDPARREAPFRCSSNDETPSIVTPSLSTSARSASTASTPSLSTESASTQGVDTQIMSAKNMHTQIVSTPSVSTQILSTPSVSTQILSTPSVSTQILSTPSVTMRNVNQYTNYAGRNSFQIAILIVSVFLYTVVTV